MDENKQTLANWQLFQPSPRFYTPLDCITRIIYVNKDQLVKLADVVLEEREWHVTNREGFRPCLFNYLDHTFRRCMETKGVYEAVVTEPQKSFLVFCTGLYSKTNDLIYCFCGPNRFQRKDTAPDRIYAIISFTTEFSLTGDYLPNFGVMPLPSSHLPPKPSYGHPLPTFNPQVPLPQSRINIAHLLREGRLEQRLTAEWRRRCRDAYRGGEKTWEKFLFVLRERFLAAITHSMQVMRLYPRLAVPHYCRSRQEVQFLVPINLTDPTRCLSEPESAVTLRLTRLPNKNQVLEDMYEINTLLPIEIAHTNARLLGVPTAPWIYKHIKGNVPYNILPVPDKKSR